MLSNQTNSTSSYFLAEEQNLIIDIFTASSMKLLIPDQIECCKKAEVNGSTYYLSASQGPKGKWSVVCMHIFPEHHIYTNRKKD